MDDANKAIEKRPKDKFYQQHKKDLDAVIQANLNKQLTFIREMVDKAHYSIQIKEKVRNRKKQMMAEQKGITIEDSSDEEEPEIKYPEECRVLDIM